MRESVSPRVETPLLGHMLAKCLPLGQVPSSMPSPPQPAPRHTSLAHTLVSSEASSCLVVTQFGARAAKLLLVARTSPWSLVTNHGYFWLNSSEDSAGCSVLRKLYFGLAADSSQEETIGEASAITSCTLASHDGRGGHETWGLHRF